VTNINKFCKR